jgi:hypothetical protein
MKLRMSCCSNIIHLWAIEKDDKKVCTSDETLIRDATAYVPDS